MSHESKIKESEIEHLKQENEQLREQIKQLMLQHSLEQNQEKIGNIIDASQMSANNSDATLFDREYTPKVLAYIRTIAAKMKTEKYEYKPVLHIIKHIKTEMERMVLTEGRLEDFLNSELNLMFIFRASSDMPLIDWKGMYERLKNHEKKGSHKAFNVLENGDVIDHRKESITTL